MLNAIDGEEEDGSQSSDPRAARRRIWRNFAYVLLGLFFNFSAFGAIFNLQTSINIEDGLGVTSLATSYLVSIFFGIVVTPVLLRRFGAKKCIVASHLCYLVYIAANLYPTYFTLVPAGVLLGFGEALIWPAISMMCVHFASEYTVLSKRSLQFHIGLFLGYYYTSFQATQVFGNLVSYAVLYGLDQTSAGTAAGNITAHNCTNGTSDDIDDKFAFCASRDCQDASVVDDSLNQYKPVNNTTLYILIGVLLLLVVLAILMHVLLAPDTGSFVKNLKTNGLLTTDGSRQKNPDSSAVELDPLDVSAPSCDVTGEKNSDLGSAVLPIEIATRSACTLAKMTITSLLKHVVQKQQLLMLPIAFYNGLAMAWAMGELTRAYVSCVLGVEWVGVCMAIYGASDCLMSWFSGRYGRRCGYTKLFVAICLIELGNYTYCLLWVPSVQNSWSLFIIFFTFGFADGMTQTIVNVVHLDFFPANREVALSVWNTSVIIGFAVAYSYSVALCITTKVYINLFFLLLGVTGAIIAQRLYQKEEATGTKTCQTSSKHVLKVEG